MQSLLQPWASHLLTVAVVGTLAWGLISYLRFRLHERGLLLLLASDQRRARGVTGVEPQGPGGPCPHCGVPLRTARARQCFACGTDCTTPTTSSAGGHPRRCQKRPLT